MGTDTLSELIQKAGTLHASDLHLVTGEVPRIRDASGSLVPLEGHPALSADVIASYAEEVLIPSSVSVQDRLGSQGDFDAAFTAGGIRTRVNAFAAHHGLSLAIRLFRDHIPSMQELGLPLEVQVLPNYPHGLIIFTAATGNGKTTSIASLLEHVNQTMERRILSIEDPIEYVFRSHRSLISQREVGTHCQDFTAGLRAALRENPDIIFVGEMRDEDTIRTALSAAETGHLVLSTLHAPDAIEASMRVLQYFPEGEQESIRNQLANSFLAIVAQKLLPKKGGGRIAAFEVLLHTDATASIIRQGNFHMLPTYMTASNGMCRMDDSIRALKMRNLLG